MTERRKTRQLARTTTLTQVNRRHMSWYLYCIYLGIPWQPVALRSLRGAPSRRAVLLQATLFTRAAPYRATSDSRRSWVYRVHFPTISKQPLHPRDIWRLSFRVQGLLAWVSTGRSPGGWLFWNSVRSTKCGSVLSHPTGRVKSPTSNRYINPSDDSQPLCKRTRYVSRSPPPPGPPSASKCITTRCVS